MSSPFTNNLAQLSGITKWAVVHAWGEGNMQGMCWVVTPQPLTTSSTVAVTSQPATGFVYPGNLGFNDGYFDQQRSPKVYQQCQQANYAGGGGTGTLSCYYGDQTIPFNNPLQTQYTSYGLNNSYAYAQSGISPITTYVQSMLNTLPATTGIIVAVTMNFSNANSTGYGIQSWLQGAAAVTIGGATASLFFNVSHVLKMALSIPGAYFHSHVCLMGEFDLVANTLGQDQFSYYLNRFFKQLNQSVGLNPDVPVVFGNMCQAWLATQTAGVNNFLSNSLKGLSNRYVNAVFVDSFTNPAIGSSAGLLDATAESLGWTGTTGPYFGPYSSRTFGLNLFNYGYSKIPLSGRTLVTLPILNLVASSTSSTNLILTWDPSKNASAYDFVLTIYNATTGAYIQSTNTSGSNTVTTSGLTQGVLYRFNVQAISDFGPSSIVSYTGSAGNTSTEFSPALSTFVTNKIAAPADGSTTVTLTVTMKNIFNQPIIGFNTSTLTQMGGSGSNALLTFTPHAGSNFIGGVQATDVNGQASWTVTCANTLSTTTTVSYGFSSILSVLGLVTFTFGNPSIPSVDLSTLTASSNTQPADGSTTITITATIISYAGTPLNGIVVAPLAVLSGSASQVHFTPGTVGGPGSSQTSAGAGTVAWVLLSGNFIGGNPGLNLGTSSVTQFQIISFAPQVAVANVNWVMLGSSATTPNTGAIPTYTTGNFSTPITGTSFGSGLSHLIYTSDTINGVTKNWIDLRPCNVAGSSGICLPSGGSSGLSTVNFSYSFWIKFTIPTTLVSNQNYNLLCASAGNPPGTNYRAVYLNSLTGPPVTYAGMISDVYNNALSGTSLASTVPVPGSWSHVVITYNNTSPFTMTMYLNGNTTPANVATGGQTGNGGSWAPTGFGTILGGGGSNQPMCNAQLADFVEYNITLTPAQVSACYNSFFLNP